MSEIPKIIESPVSRPLRMDDLINEIKPIQNNNSNRQNIEKNQKEFGDRKRIKP